MQSPLICSLNRPWITVVLAMSADGKIADASRAAARFPSATDKAHLERQIAKADATLFGAGTLRAYGTTLPVTNTDLIEARRSRHQPDQPVQIVCSAMGNFDPQWPFFRQPVPRWLITTLEGMRSWREGRAAEAGEQPFEHVLITERPFNWHNVMQDLLNGKSALSSAANRPAIQNLVVMGGGELVASLLSDGLVDDLYLTVCPLLIGGKTAPTPVSGLGFTLPRTPQLTLRSCQVEADEVFLHYSVCR
ncbi:RibD family protein [cf. Phormidesmis sp. LEGE 11477]|uniref:RibD family protein n=1 Tax=cf. Phormidesmis sp. LEGE 11477 TaxID=1828680 RepID=UPI001881737B|nr:RibD family protein [cf. Phormidesmis sp. LEGE 11477]